MRLVLGNHRHVGKSPEGSRQRVGRLDQAVSEGALANPDAIHQVVALARDPG